MTRYEDGYYKNVKCINYSPCPVCRRCENKFPEKYTDCRQCQVKGDYHTVKQKSLFAHNDRPRPKSKTKRRNKIEDIEYL